MWSFPLDSSIGATSTVSWSRLSISVTAKHSVRCVFVVTVPVLRPSDEGLIKYCCAVFATRPIILQPRRPPPSQVCYIRGWVDRSSLRKSAHLSGILQRGEIWNQYSTPVTFELRWFRNTATCLKSKQSLELEASMIGMSCPNTQLRRWLAPRAASEKQDGEICRIAIISKLCNMGPWSLPLD